MIQSTPSKVTRMISYGKQRAEVHIVQTLGDARFNSDLSPFESRTDAQWPCQYPKLTVKLKELTIQTPSCRHYVSRLLCSHLQPTFERVNRFSPAAISSISSAIDEVQVLPMKPKR